MKALNIKEDEVEGYDEQEQEEVIKLRRSIDFAEKSKKFFIGLLVLSLMGGGIGGTIVLVAVSGVACCVLDTVCAVLCLISFLSLLHCNNKIQNNYMKLNKIALDQVALGLLDQQNIASTSNTKISNTSAIAISPVNHASLPRDLGDKGS